MTSTIDAAKTAAFMEGIWDGRSFPPSPITSAFPNKSPAFDPDWEKHGHMDKVVEMFTAWAKKSWTSFQVLRSKWSSFRSRTPLIFIEIPGKADGTILMYGHLDKQPEMVGWTDGAGPWTPVQKGDKLYGRGGADDGYAMFAAISALLALKEQGLAHARAVIVIEACEESGSPDLPFYIDHLAARIGTPDLVVCLDSGCGNYDQLWLTTSLRGMVIGNLTVKVLTEGVHSGDASGVVASSFRRRAPALVADRRRSDRPDETGRAVRADPAGAQRTGQGRGRDPGR